LPTPYVELLYDVGSTLEDAPNAGLAANKTHRIYEIIFFIVALLTTSFRDLIQDQQ